jgi:FKBP-type peptidyl-prolyl cis-trans isomerase FkpA
MRRTALVLLLAAFACSKGSQDSTSAGSPPMAVPEAGGAAPAVNETITLPSGVKITHRVIGSGANPSATDLVTVHYHGTFPDGKVFDSSVDRGQPATFPLNRVIDCWSEAIPRIKVGGKAQLICPSQTAYGANGQPPLIPPNATLLFEVELLAIQ